MDYFSSADRDFHFWTVVDEKAAKGFDLNM